MRWFQLYLLKDRDRVRAVLVRARKHGFQVLQFTVDTPIHGLRKRDIRNSFSLPLRWALGNLEDTMRHPT